MLRTKRSRRNLIWNRQRINCGIRVAAVLARDLFVQDGYVMCTLSCEHAVSDSIM